MAKLYWTDKNPDCVATMNAVGALCSVEPTIGMWNTFNDMQEAGWLDGADTIGDVAARWMSWMLIDLGKVRAKRPAKPNADGPYRPHLAEAFREGARDIGLDRLNVDAGAQVEESEGGAIVHCTVFVSDAERGSIPEDSAEAETPIAIQGDAPCDPAAFANFCDYIAAVLGTSNWFVGRMSTKRRARYDVAVSQQRYQVILTAWEAAQRHAGDAEGAAA